MNTSTTGRVLALGEPALLAGYALAGATVVGASGSAEVCRVWDSLGEDVALVVLTPAAAAALGERRNLGGSCLSVVVPG